jgi:hypothetical protein
MGRRSSVDRLPKAVKDQLERMVADDRLTLDEMREQIARLYGAEHAPARSPLWRWQQKFKATAERLKESREIARGVVDELGTAPDGDQGRAMVEVLSALVMKLMMTAAERDELDLDEIRHLARVVKQTAEAQQKAILNTKEIEQAAREKLLREQAAKVDQLEKSKGMSAETADQIRRQILGLGQ